MGKFYLLHASYNGSGYHGWQKQKDVPSVQGSMYQVLDEMFEFGKKRVFAASRTDTNVNALGQVIKVLVPKRMEPLELIEALNQNLPESIRINQAGKINPSFKVTDFVTQKEYFYFLTKEYNPQFPKAVVVPEDLDFDLFSKASALFIGEHDFTNFQHRSQSKGSFKRHIYACHLVDGEEIHEDLKSLKCLRIKGNGFLKQMVRIIIGSLVNVSLGRITEEDIKNALIGEKLEEKTGFIAPGDGLFLHSIDYPESIDRDEVIDKFLWREKENPFQMFRDIGKGPVNMFENE